MALQRVTTRSSSAIRSSILTYRPGRASRLPDTSCRTPSRPHDPVEAGDVSHEVGRHQIVDQLQSTFVEHRLHEQPNLALVEVPDHGHQAGNTSASQLRIQGRIPEGFPADFISAGHGSRVYRHVVALHAVRALLEREHEVGALREGLERARAGEGTLIL